jgi:hypothetical protein
VLELRAADLPFPVERRELGHDATDVVQRWRRYRRSPMSTRIDLRTIVKSGTPREEGRRLAEALLARESVDWDDLTIEARSLPLDLFNISFFYGYLQQVFDAEPALLDRARRARLNSPYRVLEEVASKFMNDFQPRRRDAGARS